MNQNRRKVPKYFVPRWREYQGIRGKCVREAQTRPVDESSDEELKPAVIKSLVIEKAGCWTINWFLKQATCQSSLDRWRS